MTWFDLLILSILGLSVLFAWFRGLSRELSTLAALGVALFGTILVSPLLGGQEGASQSMTKNLLIIFIPFTVIFLVATIGIDMIVDRFIGKKTTPLDRWLGFAFGFIRGYLLVGLGFLALSYYFTEANQPPAIKDAALLGFAANAAAFLDKLPIDNLPSKSASFSEI